jgi:multisubunit Na+/H+ antiporter MnhF subunit
MERPPLLTVVALVTMVALQLLFGVARLLADQPWGGQPFVVLSVVALALAGLAQTVTFATWARFTGSKGWMAACLLLAVAGLVPAVAVARWWLDAAPPWP